MWAKRGAKTMKAVEEGIGDRIQFLLKTGRFLETMALVQSRNSTDVQDDFINDLREICVSLRLEFEDAGLIKTASPSGSEFWKKMTGKRIGFVDGGVARIDLPSAAPIGIRVGTYSVECGSDGPDREQFDFKSFVVDELYGNESRTFIETNDDIARMADCSRIIAEGSAVAKFTEDKFKPDLVMLHGPLVNPSAPYGTPGFPAFTKELSQELFPFADQSEWQEKDRHFVSLYQKLCQFIDESDVPCVGVIERSAVKKPQVIEYHLKKMSDQKIISKKSMREYLEILTERYLSDRTIFSILLNSGEWIEPAIINPQGDDNKWPNEWKSVIRHFPDALTSYVKSSEEGEPFRVQMTEGHNLDHWIGDLLVNTARLLPSYNFPVGLDIVDKFAKVPAWMSKGIKGQHAKVLMLKALETGDQSTINYARRIIAAKGRDWMFRPEA